MEQEIEVNMAYGWFLELDLDEHVPDHSTISQNPRRRFGEKICSAVCLTAGADSAHGTSLIYRDGGYGNSPAHTGSDRQGELQGRVYPRSF